MAETLFNWKQRAGELYCFADTLPLCRRLLAGGARIIQLRAKRINNDQFRDLAAAMQQLIHKSNEPAIFIVNDRVDIAFEIGADGVHIGQDDPDYKEVIAAAPVGMSVGVSVSTAAEARKAEQAGAHYVGAGAVFPTPTKDDAQLIGLDGLKKITDAVQIPVVAIGGLNLENIASVRDRGADYFAIISEINKSPDIAGRIDALKKRINLYGEDNQC
ncbi:MAG: thiamine phosphate synthase [Desulfobacterales bacterium]|nr:MAG: thiamine phosphate synthase [Desulfobacterales bacterium]